MGAAAPRRPAILPHRSRIIPITQRKAANSDGNRQNIVSAAILVNEHPPAAPAPGSPAAALRRNDSGIDLGPAWPALP